MLSPSVGELIEDDTTIWEREPLQTLAARDQLRAYFHLGLWQAMDTFRRVTPATLIIGPPKAAYVHLVNIEVAVFSLLGGDGCCLLW